MLILYMMYCCIHVTLYVLVVSPLLCNVDVMISTLQKCLQDALLSLVGPLSSFRIGSHLGRDSTTLKIRVMVPTKTHILHCFGLTVSVFTELRDKSYSGA